VNFNGVGGRTGLVIDRLELELGRAGFGYFSFLLACLGKSVECVLCVFFVFVGNRFVRARGLTE